MTNTKQTDPGVDPGVEDKPATDDEKLVENINEDVDPARVPQGETSEQGVDNIDDDQDELREALKGDALGGTTQVDNDASKQNASG